MRDIKEIMFILEDLLRKMHDADVFLFVLQKKKNLEILYNNNEFIEGNLFNGIFLIYSFFFLSLFFSGVLSFGIIILFFLYQRNIIDFKFKAENF